MKTKFNRKERKEHREEKGQGRFLAAFNLCVPCVPSRLKNYGF